jgi:O-acetyl-ADP-ribose deacetylase (regulator of RNase III)
MNEFKLILVNPERGLCAAWHKYFAGLANVQIVMAYFEDLPEFDCMVTAANSFGLMDGGIDAAVSRFFGVELEREVQRRILCDYMGEQPVGTSMIVETGHPKHPFVAHTPTMRVPMDIARTDNVYCAMWGMLLAVCQHNRRSDLPINTVACPGLGTAVGRVPYPEAARQMSIAYRHFLKVPTHIDWRHAETCQQDVRYGGDFGFRLPPDTEI